MDKVKVELDKDVVNELIKLKEVGLSYSDVIRRLLNKPITKTDKVIKPDKTEIEKSVVKADKVIEIDKEVEPFNPEADRFLKKHLIS